MRKLPKSKIAIVIFVFLASGTFCFGQKGRNLPYCGAFRNANRSGADVSMIAFLFIGVPDFESDNVILYSPECNNRDNFAVLDVSNLNKTDANIYGLFKNRKRPRVYLLNVKGTLIVRTVPDFGHLSFARAMFKIRHIDRIRTVENVRPPDFESDAAIIDAVNSMRDKNSEFIISHVGGKCSFNNAFDHLKIFMNRIPFSESDCEILKQRGLGQVAVTIADAEQVADNWQLSGNLKLASQSNAEFRYKFLSLFQKDAKGEFSLVRLELLEEN